jgi:hypothetical protein
MAPARLITEQSGQCYISFKNICCVGSALIAALTIDIFETDR